MLIHTVRGDLEPVALRDDPALLRYSAGVAGTVGLLMAPLLGTGNPAARAPAEALGIAIQLTNICRDVREDAARGRIYLPLDRLRAAGLADPRPDTVLGAPEVVSRVVGDLLDLADSWYERARAGYPPLPVRSRLAVGVAVALYRQIGVCLRQQHGGNPLFGRTIVPTGQRLRVVFAVLPGLIWPRRRPDQSLLRKNVGMS